MMSNRLAGISSTTILIPKMVTRSLFPSACQGLDEMLNVAGVLVVLIGDTDDREHSVAPVFKISDFGMGKKLPETDPDLQDPYVNEFICS